MEKDILNQKSTIFWILKQSRKQLFSLMILVALCIALSALRVVFVLGMQWLIDGAVADDPQLMKHACYVLTGCGLAVVTLSMLRSHYSLRSAAQMDIYWKKTISHILLHAPYEQTSAQHSAEWLTQMNSDAACIYRTMLSVVPGVASMLTTLIAAACLLFDMEPKLLLMIVVVSMMGLAATGLLRHRLKAIHKQIAYMNGRVSGFLQEMMSKVMIVKAFSAQEEVERREQKLLGERFCLQNKYKNLRILADGGLNLFSNVCSIFALIWCAAGLLHHTMSIGTMTAILQLLEQVKRPLVSFSSLIPQYAAMVASAERLMEITEMELEPDAQGSGDLLYGEMQAISAESLAFAYPAQEGVITYRDFTIPKGTLAAIYGISGGGKSTLLKLFLGILKPTGGRLCMDRKPLDHNTRHLFAYVPQEHMLFSGTIRDNILLANPDAEEGEIRQALYVSDLDTLIHELPEGLDTCIGENALGISEGQAQRISIARAVVSAAPILLLDEATSALDAATERRVLERLAALKDRTVIMVTHRPAALEMADVIIQVGETEDKDGISA